MILGVFITTSVIGQGLIPERHWTHTDDAAAGDDSPTVGVDDWYYNIIQTSDGGYVGVGFTEINGEFQPSIAKLNAHGVTVWEKTYDNGNLVNAGVFFDVVETTDGYVAVGNKRDMTGLNGDINVYVVKVNKQTGAIASGFPKLFGVTDFGDVDGDGIPDGGESKSIQLLPSGGFVIAGSVLDRQARPVEAKAAFLLEIDASGIYVNHNTYNLSAGFTAIGKTVIINYNAVGVVQGYFLVGTSIALTNGLDEDVLVVKTDLGLTPLFQNVYSEASLVADVGYVDNLSTDISECPTCTGSVENTKQNGFDGKQVPYLGNPSDGNIVISAQFDVIRCNCNGAFPLTGVYREFDATVFEIDQSGNAVWAQNPAHFTGIDFFNPIEIQTCGSGYEILTVGNNMQSGQVVNHLIKMDAVGGVVWEKKFNDGNDINCVFGLAVTNDGGYVVAGNNVQLSSSVYDEDYYAIKVYSDRQPTAFTNSNPSDITIPYDIATTESWSGLLGSRTVYDQITVKSGGHLIIDGNAIIRFADSRQMNDFEDLAANGTGLKKPRIVVEPNGRLTVNNATLTGMNICGQEFMWEGIQVLGNPTVSQAVSNQGRIVLDNATIENAIMGVLANGSNYNVDGHQATDILALGGGIVQARNSTFRNCRRSIHFSSYPFSATALGSSSFVRECTFETTAPMVDPDYVLVDGSVLDGTRLGNNSFLSSWNTHNLKIEGNIFTNGISLPGTYEGNGIVTVDARIFVRRTCGLVYTSGGCAGAQNEFNNLNYGVRCSGSNVLNSPYIDGCKFNNNNQAIYLVGLNAATITRNSFDVGQVAGRPYGIYLYNCSGYQVEENDFTTSLPASAMGMLVYNNDVNNNNNANEVYNNVFSNLLAGTIGMAENRGNLNFRGLDFLCNDYVNNQFDEYVRINPGISIWQGGFTSSTDQTIPAGNTFDGCSTPDGELSNSVGSPSPLSFTYWHHSDLITTPNPGCYTLGQVSPQLGCPSCLTYNKSMACPSSFVPNIVDVLRLKKNDSEGQIVTLTAALAALIDGGDTQGVLDDMASLSPGQIKNLLLGLSPYLSDKVLITYINSGAPPGHIKQVILANAPVTDDVMDVLNTSKLPNGIINIINNAQTGVSEREKKEAELGFYQTEREIAVNGIIREYLHNDSLVGHLDSVALILKIEQRVTAKCELTDLLRQQGKFTEATNLIDSLSTADSTGSLTEFCAFQRLLIQLEQAGETCFKMKDNASTKQEFDNIAAKDGKTGCSQAQALIDLVFNTGIPEVFVPIIGSSARMSQHEDEDENIREENLSKVSVYPNPASEFFIVEFELPKGSESGMFLLYDMMGKQILYKNLSGERGKITIALSGLSTGLYFYSLVVNNTTIARDKLIINK